ncbi:beta-lactamase hydrolase-like protein [Ditylenchus destructor]|uniref:Beta-lactamase hydrolase-like protein n=1 Tax=Ditylenchus destructor TaxID=166010 RepID=A0AAD4ME36_9BILA|nr:beta-lactamase hydrolase-like protein [Ditylenchus destructor]
MMEMPMQTAIEAFFDEPTNTITYLVADPATGDAAVIDPVHDFDPGQRRDRFRLGRSCPGRGGTATAGGS